jgi:hypothetical protein
MYIIRNADGLQVSEYELLSHAQEAAEQMAREGTAANLDFYSVEDGDGAEFGAWRSVDTADGAEAMSA